MLSWVLQHLGLIFLLVKLIQNVEGIDHAHSVIDQQGIVVFTEMQSAQSGLSAKFFCS